jgi:hypothetical protein
VSDHPRQPTPSLYAGLMLGAGALAVGAAWLVAASGGGNTPQLAAACTAFGAILSLVPAVFGPRREVGNWGMAVLGCSMARLLLMLGLGLAIAPAPAPRAYWMGIVAGAGTLLVCETGAAAFIITRLEQIRAARPGAEHA